MHRYDEIEFSARMMIGIKRQSTSNTLGHHSCKRKAKTSALNKSVQFSKTFKDCIFLFRRDTWSGIYNREEKLIILIAHVKGDTTLVGKLSRIVEQLSKNGLNHLGMGSHHQILCDSTVVDDFHQWCPHEN